MAAQAIINVGLLVRVEAKTGREEEVESLLKSALQMVDAEDGTTVWFAVRMGLSTFGIFDAFPDDEARQAHLSGAVAAQLRERADELFSEPPTIEPVDVLAVKLPALAGTTPG